MGVVLNFSFTSFQSVAKLDVYTAEILTCSIMQIKWQRLSKSDDMKNIHALLVMVPLKRCIYWLPSFFLF